MRTRNYLVQTGLGLLMSMGMPAVAFMGDTAGDVDGTVEVASLLPDGRLADTLGTYGLSGNGRFVVFESVGLIFRRDLQEGVTEVLSLPRHHYPRVVEVSRGGRFVVYLITDIVGPRSDRRLVADIYVHDARRDATHRVVRISDRMGGAHLSEGPVLGSGLRHVAFASRDPDFAAHDVNARRDVFVFDRRTRDVELVSATPRGRPGNGQSCCMDMTADGSAVVFTSVASNLVRGDTNDKADVFLRDLDAGTTSRLNVTTDGGQSPGPGCCPTISADGSIVTFVEQSSLLDPNAPDNEYEYVVRDLTTGTTSPLAEGSNRPVLSHDGRYVAYYSSDPDITNTSGCTDSQSHVYLLDRLEQATTCVSPDLDPQANMQSWAPLISADGEAVAFYTELELLPDLEFAERIHVWSKTTVP